MAFQAYLAFFLLILYTGNGLAFITEKEELISLYDENDSVVELTDSNFTSSIHSDTIWVVEFYAHWCGHCQRFSPTWKNLAKEFDVPEWQDSVQFGAINCAQQSVCQNYTINGTPTIRIFYGGPAWAGQGTDIPVYLDIEQLRPALLKQLETAQSYGYLKSEKLPNFLLVSGLQNTPPKNKKMIGYIAEEQNRGVLGRDMVFFASKKFSDLEIRRMDWTYAQNSLFQYRRLPTPSIILLPVDQNAMDWQQMVSWSPLESNRMNPYLPSLRTPKGYRDQMLNYISNQYDSWFARNNRATTTSTTTTVAPSSTADLIIVEDFDDNEIEEVIYMADLERAIYYIVDTEIVGQETLDELKLKAIYQMFENIVKYLPLRKPLRQFLSALRDWPGQMDFKTLKSHDYNEKVKELMEIHKPFQLTPDEWIGCKGSKPQFRGYPCALWQLFHTMMVNAASKGDPSMVLGGPSTVAKTMINYILYFFSCRHCADNFRLKVTKMGFLPSTPRDSILWLWQIHNMANIKLKGDSTEDPTHPKIVWPTELNCPNCRSDRADLSYSNPQIAFVHGQLWNLTALVAHHHRVYGADHLIAVDPSHFQGKRIEALQKLSALAHSEDSLAIAVDDFCSKYSAS